MRIGVLALQGDFIEHEEVFSSLGQDVFEIRQPSDLNGQIDGLVLPGGESTVMGKLLHELGLFDKLKAMIENGLPVFATCAGMILLAEKLSGDSKTHFATMNITVKRNAYGRQLGSFRTIAPFGTLGDIPMTFIRAPYIESARADVDILASVDGKAVGAIQNNQIAIAFHPELDSDYRIFNYFLDICKNHLENK